MPANSSEHYVRRAGVPSVGTESGPNIWSTFRTKTIQNHKWTALLFAPRASPIGARIAMRAGSALAAVYAACTATVAYAANML